MNREEAISTIREALEWLNIYCSAESKAQISYKNSLQALAFLETDGNVLPDGWISIRKEVRDFLDGAKPIDSCWFSDTTKPSNEKGYYWWRKYLWENPEATIAKIQGKDGGG